MTDFMSNMLTQTSDGTAEGDLGVVPKTWSSESVYLVQFIGNTDCTEDPSGNDGLLYITEATEICQRLQVKAKLFDASGQFQQGTVNSDGHWTLT